MQGRSPHTTKVMIALTSAASLAALWSSGDGIGTLPSRLGRLSTELVPGALRQISEALAGAPLKLEPFSFEVFSGPVIADRGFRFTCTSEAGLTVNRVVFNGTYLAKPVRMEPYGLRMRDDETGLPARLSIGESVRVGYEWGYLNSPRTYDKTIIFIDVDTNTGVYRFGPDGGFLGTGTLRPTVELERLTEAEDRARADRAKEAEISRRELYVKPLYDLAGLKYDPATGKEVDRVDRKAPKPQTRRRRK
jgi:hypothetical protein